jgi:hypothetical protein
VVWGVGMDSSILDASLQAVVSAANRLRELSTEGEPVAESHAAGTAG